VKIFLQVFLVGFFVFGSSSVSDARSIFDWWDGVTGPGCNSNATNIDKEIENCNVMMGIKLHKDQSSPAHNRGILWRKKGHLDKAVRDFGIALKKHSNSHQSLFERGKTLMMMGRYKSAIRNFSELLRWTKIYKDGGFYHRGLCYEKLRMFKQAQKDFQSAYHFDLKFKKQSIEKMKIYGGEWYEFRK
jgi:tetratricopeptide (TPR) repeat protein